ncbi:MAG: DUF6913 domain-containing protein [Flammeovirgaceae bacterium]
MNFLKIRTQSALKNNKALRASTPYKQAANMGIVFTVEDKQKHQYIKEFIHKLERDGKKVRVLEYLPEKKENHEFLFDFFTIKDLSFWGKVNSNSAIRFCDIPFDYLFCIDMQSNPLILHLMAKSKARCRVGRFNESESAFFEMMIEQAGTTKNLTETIYKYIQELR